MRPLLFGTLLFCFVHLHSTFGCDCGPQPVAQRVEHASIVFVGRAVFTDEDGTGSVQQQTLVHFQIEESFKALASEIHDVWVDPGSFTECYYKYSVGTRYIVFAYESTWPRIGTNADHRNRFQPRSTEMSRRTSTGHLNVQVQKRLRRRPSVPSLRTSSI
jgi:hypothetical protein